MWDGQTEDFFSNVKFVEWSMVLLNPSCLKEVIMNKENKKVVAAVTGTTAIIKKMLGHKISQAKIVETLIPMFT